METSAGTQRAGGCVRLSVKNRTRLGQKEHETRRRVVSRMIHSDARTGSDWPALGGDYARQTNIWIDTAQTQ